VAARAVRRSEPELVPPPFLPGALEREEGVDLAAPEPEAAELSAVGWALREVAELVPVEPESEVLEPGAAGEGEPAEVGPVDVGTEDACPTGAGIEGSVSMESAATGAGPAGPELL
jgi:hypothetical protein